MLSDLLLAAWIIGVAAALLLVAAPAVFSVRRHDRTVRAIEAAALLTLLTIVAVGMLSAGRLLNWFTLLLVCLSPPLVRWLRQHRWSVDRGARETARRAAIAATHALEGRSWRRHVAEALRSGRARWAARLRAAGPLGDPGSDGAMVAGFLTAAAAVTIYLRFGPVFGDPRLGSPEAYAVLLQARQALANQPGALLTPVTAALAAAVSIATSLNTVHVVRLMAPAVGVILVCAAALFARRMTASATVSVMVFWILGACTLGLGGEPPTEVGPAWILDRTLARQWTAHDGTTALLFLVLACICLESWRRSRPAAVRGAAACSLIVGLASPWLLILLIPVGAARFVPRNFRLVTIGTAWTAITFVAASKGPSDVAFALPVAIAFLVSGVWGLLADYASRIVRTDLRPAAAAVLVLTTLAMLPQRTGGLYLEHEITAVKTLEIASVFPRGRWLIVAPIEQLAEVYGRGWFQDPVAFLDANAARAGDPSFAFDVSVDDLFVVVERVPFKTFASEATHVPFATLADPSYRQYRSLAGRATLQAQLLRLCEAYRRTHDDASIYYEDAKITIYRIHLRA